MTASGALSAAQHDRPARLALAPGIVVAAAVATIVAAATAAPSGAAERSPIAPPGAWASALGAAVAAAVVAWVVGSALLRRVRKPPTAAVLAIAAVIQLAPLAAPTLLSSDVYTYWAYGRVGAVHDANPYADPPQAFPGDPAYARMGETWRDVTTLYGPLFTAASEVHATTVGASASTAAVVYRAAAAVAMILIVLMVAWLAPRPAFGAAFVGWNPLLPLHFAGGGHNDAWMIALVVVALAFAATGRAAAAGASWAAAIGVKWVPLVLLPLELVHRRDGRRALVAGFVAGLAAIALAASVLYGTEWLSAAGRLSRQARATGSLGLSDVLGDLGLGHRATLVLLATGFAAVYAWLLFEAWRRRRRRLGFAAGAFALAQGWLNPWYALWPVALTAIDDDRAARVLAIALTIYLILDVVPR